MTEIPFWIQNLPASIAIMVIAALPIVELRGAIPIALTIFDYGVVPAYILAIIGNLVPVVFVLYVFEKIMLILAKKWQWFDQKWTWLYSKTRDKHAHKFATWGAIALVSFVAIPLPFTGAWSGALAALVFKVPRWQAIAYIFIGLLIAGVIVSLITLGLI